MVRTRAQAEQASTTERDGDAYNSSDDSQESIPANGTPRKPTGGQGLRPKIDPQKPPGRVNNLRLRKHARSLDATSEQERSKKVKNSNRVRASTGFLSESSELEQSETVMLGQRSDRNGPTRRKKTKGAHREIGRAINNHATVQANSRASSKELGDDDDVRSHVDKMNKVMRHPPSGQSEGRDVIEQPHSEGEAQSQDERQQDEIVVEAETDNQLDSGNEMVDEELVDNDSDGDGVDYDKRGRNKPEDSVPSPEAPVIVSQRTEGRRQAKAPYGDPHYEVPGQAHNPGRVAESSSAPRSSVPEGSNRARIRRPNRIEMDTVAKQLQEIADEYHTWAGREVQNTKNLRFKEAYSIEDDTPRDIPFVELRSLLQLMGHAAWSAKGRGWAAALRAELSSHSDSKSVHVRGICTSFYHLQDFFSDAPRHLYIRELRHNMQEYSRFHLKYDKVRNDAIRRIDRWVEWICDGELAPPTDSLSKDEQASRINLFGDLRRWIIPMAVSTVESAWQLGGEDGEFYSTTVPYLVRTCGWVRKLRGVLSRQIGERPLQLQLKENLKGTKEAITRFEKECEHLYERLQDESDGLIQDIQDAKERQSRERDAAREQAERQKQQESERLERERQERIAAWRQKELDLERERAARLATRRQRELEMEEKARLEEQREEQLREDQMELHRRGVWKKAIETGIRRLQDVPEKYRPAAPQWRAEDRQFLTRTLTANPDEDFRWIGWKLGRDPRECEDEAERLGLVEFVDP